MKQKETAFPLYNTESCSKINTEENLEELQLHSHQSLISSMNSLLGFDFETAGMRDWPSTLVISL